MHSKNLKEWNRIFLSKLIEKHNWHTFLKISDSGFAKIQVLAIRRLLDGDYMNIISQWDEKAYPKVSKKKVWTVQVITLIKFLQLIVVFILLKVKARLAGKKKSKNIFESTDVIFIADSNRSYFGFNELTKHIPKSKLICVLYPSNIKQNLSYLQFNGLLTTGTRINFSSILRGIYFLFKYVPEVLKAYSFFSVISNNNISYYLFDFLRSILHIPAAKKIAQQFPASSIAIFKDDCVYFNVALIEELKRRKIPTVHQLHGISIEDNFIIIPMITDYLFCCGNREKIFYDKVFGTDKVFDVSAPMQTIETIEKLKAIPEITTKKYDIVIIGGYELYWMHKEKCKIIEQCQDFFSTQKILLRNHPNSPGPQRKLLETSIKFFDLSAGRTLQEDINNAEIILSFSIDANHLCLHLKKKVIYFAITGGNIHHYSQSLENKLENFIIADNKEEIINGITFFQQNDCYIDPVEYEKKMVWLFGEYKMPEVVNNFNLAIKKIQQNE